MNEWITNTTEMDQKQWGSNKKFNERERARGNTVLQAEEIKIHRSHGLDQSEMMDGNAKKKRNTTQKEGRNCTHPCLAHLQKA